MELEPRPDVECPCQAVRREVLGFNHLTLRLQLFVQSVKCIPHHGRGIAHHVLGVPDRIEIRKVCLRHEAQRARRRALRDRRRLRRVVPCEPARCRQGARAGGRLQECSSIHDHRLSRLWPRIPSESIGGTSGLRQPAPPSPHEAAVVGSIIFFTSVILVAGKPLISACLRMIASSLAR
jgi:hypothetical protein